MANMFEGLVIHSERVHDGPSLREILASMPKGATLYKDRGYEGAAHLFTEGRYSGGDMVGYRMLVTDMLRESLDNAVSSIKLDAGFKVTLYDRNDFTGPSKTFTSSVDYVGDDWQDKASSIVVEKA